MPLAETPRLNSFQMKMLDYFVEKLAATHEGDSTMLDQMLLLYGSGMSDSDLHLHRNLPIVVAHGKDLGIQGNRYIKPAEGTPLANLHLALLDKLGLAAEKFGDSNGELNLMTGI